MESNAITPMQKDVLTRHFLSKIDEETDRLWENGILDQNALNAINNENLHTSR
jgi:hypothetical protein